MSLRPASLIPITREIKSYQTKVSLYDLRRSEHPDWEQELEAFWHTDVEIPATLRVDGKGSIPAPQANYVRVVINGESWAIYANQRTFSNEFLKERLGASRSATRSWRSLQIGD